MIEDGTLEVRGVSLKDLVVNVDDLFHPDCQLSKFEMKVKTSLEGTARLIADDADTIVCDEHLDASGRPAFFPAGCRIAIQVLYDMIMRTEVDQGESKAVVNYASVYEIVYLVKSRIDAPEKFHGFVQAHAPQAAWPYFREFSQSTLIRMGFNAIPGIPFVLDKG